MSKKLSLLIAAIFSVGTHVAVAATTAEKCLTDDQIWISPPASGRERFPATQALALGEIVATSDEDGRFSDLLKGMLADMGKTENDALKAAPGGMYTGAEESAKKLAAGVGMLVFGSSDKEMEHRLIATAYHAHPLSTVAVVSMCSIPRRNITYDVHRAGVVGASSVTYMEWALSEVQRCGLSNQVQALDATLAKMGIFAGAGEGPQREAAAMTCVLLQAGRAQEAATRLVAAEVGGDNVKTGEDALGVADSSSVNAEGSGPPQ